MLQPAIGAEDLHMLRRVFFHRLHAVCHAAETQSGQFISLSKISVLCTCNKGSSCALRLTCLSSRMLLERCS